MAKRFVSIWFRYLITDWFAVKQPLLNKVAFVVSAPSHGKMVVTAANALAEVKGVYCGLALADARAMIPGLQVVDDKPGLAEKLLKRIAEWCIRYTPVAATDGTDGIVLDVTGCPHLWGGDQFYLTEITNRLKARGYHVRAAMADTIGTAWAVARYGKDVNIISKAQNTAALLSLPAAALRLNAEIVERLNKLGLRQVKDFVSMPASALRRRFGNDILQRLNQALGLEEEIIEPVIPVAVFSERLPCLEPIVTATGIEIALQRLLKILCEKLQQEEKGLRQACFKCYRVDGKIQEIQISTIRPSSGTIHLFKLFENKIQTIEPDLGIELFVLEAPAVEDHVATQEKLWEAKGGLEDLRLAELIDRLTDKLGGRCISRFLPAEHYLPERSFTSTALLQQKAVCEWKVDKPRPMQLLALPEQIQVTAPVPDYPPMNFRHNGKLHKILKADGPERIEQEWWIQDGQHRDYYLVEDEQGYRYWLFRLGHYDEDYKWFIHGVFA